MYILDVLVRPIVMVLAIIMTVRAGRGYGFGILAMLLLICTILDLSLYSPQPPMSLGSALIFSSGGFQSDAVATGVLLIGATIVAGIDGHWLWLVGLIVAGLVTAFAATLPLSFWGMASDPAVQQQGIMGVLLSPVGAALLAIPQAAVLVYSVARIVHSTRTRQPAPLS